MVGDVYACIYEVRIIERLEGIKLLGTLLGGSVASQQAGVEVDAHLRH